MTPAERRRIVILAKRPMRPRAGWPAGVASILVLSLVTPLVAAPRRGPQPAPGARGDEDVRGSIQVLMIVSMKKALELTRDQEMEVVPRVQQMLEQREHFARERRDTFRRLQVRVMEEAAPERDLREAVVHLDRMETQHRDLERRLREEIDRSLSPRQQVQFRLFVPRFRKQIQLQIEQARRLQAPRVRPLPPPPSDDSEFYDDEF